MGWRERAGGWSSLLFLAALLSASGCKVKATAPSAVPFVDIYEIAQFTDLDYDYGRALVKADSDGDGSEELVVGSPARDPAGDGVVLLVSLHDFAVVNVVLPWRAPGETSGHHDEYGRALAVGDFDDDGRVDLAVGDPGADVGSVAQAGEVWVYFGPIDTTQPQRLRAGSVLSGARFGETLAAGDFDGDGYEDLAVASPHPANLTAATSESSIDVFFGPSLTRTERWTASGVGGRFGVALLPIPSLNGGAALLAGAPERTTANGGSGGMLAWERATAVTVPRLIGEPQASDADLGRACGLGDFNGDGTVELAMLATAGRGGVYFFDPDTLFEQRHLALPSLFAPRQGAPMARLADVTGDHADEIVLLSANSSELAGLLFSPGRGDAHVQLEFAAAAMISGNFDGDSNPELLLATPTSFLPTGGFSKLRVLDVSWQATRTLAAPTQPAVIPGMAALRGE